jgi:hypothetical protein
MRNIKIVYYVIKILKTGTHHKCRLCQQYDKTVDHIISTCPLLAKEQYIKGHDRVFAQLHFNICKEIGLQLDSEHWYACTKIGRTKAWK